MNPKIKKYVGYVTTGILAALLIAVFVIFGVVMVQVIKGDVPTMFGYRFYYVLTDSMTPTYPPGTVLIAKKFDGNADDIPVGTVVTYIGSSGIMNGQQVTHRVEVGVYFDQGLNDYAVRTRGDKSGAALDDPVRLSSIQSVVKGDSAFLTWLFGIFKNGAGLALVVSIPLVIMLVVLIFRLVAVIKNKEEPKPEQSEEERIAEIKKRAVEEYIKNNKDRDKPDPGQGD